MNVNCTLFVQIANFFVAFFLLKRFLWRPVVRTIEQEASLRRVLESSIGVKRAELMQKNDALRRQWYEAKKSFAQMAPAVAEQPCLISLERPHEEQKPIDEQLISSLVTVVVTRVRRD